MPTRRRTRDWDSRATGSPCRDICRGQKTVPSPHPSTVGADASAPTRLPWAAGNRAAPGLAPAQTGSTTGGSLRVAVRSGHADRRSDFCHRTAARGGHAQVRNLRGDAWA